MIGDNAKTLRSSQIETSKAITKINEIRGTCEGFAEKMLTKATEGLAPDIGTVWSAFSGVLTSEQLEHAEWGDVKKKVPGSRSKNVFNVAAFQGAESPPPPTPV